MTELKVVREEREENQLKYLEELNSLRRDIGCGVYTVEVLAEKVEQLIDTIVLYEEHRQRGRL